MNFVGLIMLLVATTAVAEGVETRTGVELGLAGAKYGYKEPSLSVKDEGYNGGVLGTATWAVGNGWFGKLDGRSAVGSVDYTGSGTHKGEEIWLNDGRVLVGRDSGGSTSVWAPYTGIGYRSLYNDARGVTSTGAVGYRRLNTMLYVPIGTEYRTSLTGGDRLTVGVETDIVVSSEQKSYLADAGVGERDIVNKQRGGAGLRAHVGYGFGDNEVGVFGQYWDMADSKPTRGLTATWMEPANQTTEVGVYYKRRLEF
ncbi:MAG: hypothetical protein WAZ18_06740 [Alphaproteobacteria bacterium]